MFMTKYLSWNNYITYIIIIKGNSINRIHETNFYLIKLPFCSSLIIIYVFYYNTHYNNNNNNDNWYKAISFILKLYINLKANAYNTNKIKCTPRGVVLEIICSNIIIQILFCIWLTYLQVINYTIIKFIILKVYLFYLIYHLKIKYYWWWIMISFLCKNIWLCYYQKCSCYNSIS